MGPEVFDRDLPALGRVVGQDLRDLILEADLALLDQQEDGDGRELLGDRAQAEDHVGRDRHAELEVGQAVALAEDRPAALADDDGRSGLSGLVDGGHHGVDLRGQVVRDRRPGRKGPGERAERSEGQDDESESR